jgi:ABC-type glycerol-3-phosphate transport system substrate-binding protein
MRREPFIMRKFIALLVVMALIIGAMAGCATKTSQKEQQPSQEAQQPTQPQVTIKFWQAGGDTAGAAEKMSELIKKFEEKHPNIKVEYMAIPWAEEPHNKFQTAIVSGEVADLLIVGSPFDHVLASSGAIIPLDQFIDEELKKDLMDVFSREGIYHGKNKDLDGKLISIPMFGDARTIVYNKDIFKKAGVPEPTESWTLEEFKQNALKLTKDGVYGFGTSGRYASQWLPFVWDKGGEILNQEMTEATITTPEWKEAWEYYIELINKASMPGSVNVNLAEIQKLFAQEKVAMFVTTQDYVEELMKDPNLKDKIGVGQMPHDKYQTAFAGADVFVITKQSKHPKEAWELLRFLVSTENQLEYCKTVGFLPAVKSAASDPYFTNDPVKKGFLQALEHGKFYVKSDKANGITTILRAEIQNAITGKKSVQKALEDAKQAIDLLLNS